MAAMTLRLSVQRGRGFPLRGLGHGGHDTSRSTEHVLVHTFVLARAGLHGTRFLRGGCVDAANVAPFVALLPTRRSYHPNRGHRK